MSETPDSLPTEPPEPIIHSSTTYYATLEVITGRVGEWEMYEDRCAGAPTAEEARERFLKGEGGRIIGKRRVSPDPPPIREEGKR